MATLCAAPGCTAEATTRCPICVKLGTFEGSHFCSQKCFKNRWKSHKAIHKEAERKLKALEDAELDGKVGGDRREALSFSSALASIKITPNKGEDKDANFPKNLHNAGELFIKLNLIEHAKRLHASTLPTLAILRDGPDGKTSHNLGRGCVCWNCGMVGLPKNADKVHARKLKPAGVCSNCGTDDQTNFIKVVCGDGEKEVPWMEVNKSVDSGGAAAKCVEALKEKEEGTAK